VNYIEELKAAIKRLHGVESTHLKSVPVKETFQGKIVWDGIVEVFELHGHHKAPLAYAWMHQTDEPKIPKRHIAVLHFGAVTSPLLAVRAAIIQEFRNLEPTEES
jgi:hypothetical protein